MTTVRSSGNAFKVNTGGTVTITDVTVNHTAENTSYFVQNSGSFTMTGGSFTAVAKTGTGYMFYSNGTLTIERTPITTTVEGSAKTRVFHAYGNASDTNKMTVKNSTISMMVGGTGIYFYRADGTPAVEFDTCTITGQDTVKVDYLFYNNGSGTLTFNGGTVQSGDGAKYATLIYNNGTSTLNLTNTTVSNKTSEAGSVILNRNTLNITGGEVKVETHSSSTKDIYAIQSTKGVVKIDGASITVNAPDFVSNGKQAAIYIKNDNGSVDSDVTLKDTTISVTSKRDKEAYGILLEGGRIESITGGSITMTYEASYSRHKGYGIYQNGAASSIGTISGTTIAAGKKGEPYGIYVNASAADNLTLTGGTTVTADKSSDTSALYVAAAGFVKEIDNATLTSTGYRDPVIENYGVIYKITKNAKLAAYDKYTEALAGTGVALFPEAGQGIAYSTDENKMAIFTVQDNQTAVGEPVASIGSVEYDDLRTALALANDGETVKLLAALQLDADSAVTASGRSNVTLDLNGHSITNSGANALTVSGSTLTITDNSSGEKGALISTNGYGLGTSGAASTITLGGGITVEGSSHGAYINVSGDVLNADGVTITGQGNYGLYLAAPAGASVENCTISGKTRGVHINNTKAGTAAAKTTLAFTSNTITGSGTAAADAGFSLNTTGNYTDVTLTGGSITGGTSGFYQNTTGANTTVTVNNVSLNGRSYGAYFNTANASGTVTLDGASAVGGLYGVYNANMPGTASLTLDGITAKGEVAALYTESGKTTVLSDETNTHFSGLNATAGNGTVTYPGAYIGFKENGTDESTGYKSWSMTDDTDELPVAGEKVSVTVGGTETKYATFADAFAAADDNGGTIKLLEDVTEVVGTAFTVPEGKEITIDLNGKTFKAIVTATKVMDLFTNNGTLNFTDNSVQSRTDAGEDDRGAVDGAGRLLLENGNNLQHVLVRNNNGASRVSVERVTLEVGGTNNGITIQLGTGSLLEHVTDATIIAPRYGIYDGSKYNQNNTGASVGDLTNSVIKVTDTVGTPGTNHETYDPVAVYLNDYNGTTTMGDITNCLVESNFFGISLRVKSVGDITNTTIRTAQEYALEILSAESVGDITHCDFTANLNDQASYFDSYVLSLYYCKNVGAIKYVDILGATGITANHSTIKTIQNCTINSEDYSSGLNTSGTGLNFYSGVEITGEDGIAIGNCEISAYEDAMSLETVTINGDIVKSSFTSKTASGIGDTNGGSSTINGDIKDCTISGKVYGLQLKGSVKNIIGCTISADYEPAPNAGTQTGYALHIYGKVEGKVEDTTMTGHNSALPFKFEIYYPWPSGEEFVKSTVTLEDCTFEDADADGYKVNNKGFSMDIGGSGYENGDSGTYYANDYWFASDATINLERVSPMSEEFNLGCDADDWDNKYTNNPLAKKLTLQSDESIEGGVTLTRAEDYKGQMFHVQNGTLELKDITLRGNSDAQDTMIYVSNYGSEYCLIVGDGAVLTGNTNTSSSGGAIRCKGDLVIDGGTISNNSARQSGGGVDFSGSGTLTINGGTITGNSCANGASGNGGGVYISGSPTAIKMSGSPVITGNTKSGAANNFHLSKQKYIQFTGDLGDDAQIGVITATKPQNSSPVQISTAESGTAYYSGALEHFSSDDEHYAVSINETGKYLQLALGYTVTVNDEVLDEKAPEGVDYVYTIPEYNPDDLYEISVTVTGEAVTVTPGNDGKLTIPGEEVYGNIVINWETLTGKNITLTLDPNEGALPADASNTVTAQIGGEYPTLPTPVRPGYTFEGWFTDGGTKIEAGGKVELTEDTTLTAKWTAKDITVSFDLNGGEGNFPDITNKLLGDEISIPADEPTRDGYTFAGWSDGKNTYDPGDSYTLPTEDTTLTAQWSKNGEPTPGFIINVTGGEGGTVSPEGVVLVVSGGSVTITIDPDDGYRVLDVIVDGVSVGPTYSYTFSNVDRNHTLEVVFAKAGVADPGVTGVADSLITGDHIKFLNGYPGGTFNPDGNMTRAEAAQMFYNLLLNKNVQVTVSFSDVPEAAWYSDAVNALASMNILNGVGGGKFDPDRAITRAEFTAIAMRFAKSTAGGANIFTDVASGAWYYESVLGAVNFGWITGYPDGTFRPNNTITRAEVTTIVNRMLGRAADTEYVDAHVSELVQFSDVTKAHWAYYQIVEATNAHDFTKADGVEDWTALK